MRQRNVVALCTGSFPRKRESSRLGPRLRGDERKSGRLSVMIVPMVIVVTVVRVIVRAMLVAARRGIGAAFGIERRSDLDNRSAELAGHVRDHMIAADAQRAGQKLRRQMAIAEMPGDAREMQRVGAADFEERLRRGNDLDKTAVVEHQRVAVAQFRRCRQIEQKRECPWLRSAPCGGDGGRRSRARRDRRLRPTMFLPL